jgi:hypothetical protein
VMSKTSGSFTAQTYNGQASTIGGFSGVGGDYIAVGTWQ